MARTLFFQFADHAYEIDTGVNKLIGDNSHLVDNMTLKPTIVQCCQDFRSLAWDGQKTASITALMHALKVRTTSVASDEALCLAALLNVDIARVWSAPVDARMRVLWQLVKKVPAALVFYTGRTLEHKGLRWAPASFLRPASQEDDLPTNIPQYFNPELGDTTPDGLRVTFDGYELYLASGSEIIGHTFMRDEFGRFLQVHLPKHKEGYVRRTHRTFLKPYFSGRNMILDLTGLLRSRGHQMTNQNGTNVFIVYIIMRRVIDEVAPANSGMLFIPTTPDPRQGKGTILGDCLCRLNITLIGSAEAMARKFESAGRLPLKSVTVLNDRIEASPGRGLLLSKLKHLKGQSWCVS